MKVAHIRRWQAVVTIVSLSFVPAFHAQSVQPGTAAANAEDADSCLGRLMHGQPQFNKGALTGIKLFPNEGATRQDFAR
ncbi:MAG TPA: hypothetical protein VGO61_06285, partial [Steroidobacteraceae bacterium]|nr:hypothetical protein [Steroidobacteraceae bacterium]